MELSSTVDTNVKKLDVVALWGGILFSFAFVALIWWAGPRLDAIELLPDQGASWYYWKLPDPTFWSRATAWGFYLAHQIAFWGQIKRPLQIAYRLCIRKTLGRLVTSKASINSFPL